MLFKNNKWEHVNLLWIIQLKWEVLLEKFKKIIWKCILIERKNQKANKRNIKKIKNIENKVLLILIHLNKKLKDRKREDRDQVQVQAQVQVHHHHQAQADKEIDQEIKNQIVQNQTVLNFIKII